jgi:hypothetical protein
VPGGIYLKYLFAYLVPICYSKYISTTNEENDMDAATRTGWTTPDDGEDHTAWMDMSDAAERGEAAPDDGDEDFTSWEEMSDAAERGSEE